MPVALAFCSMVRTTDSKNVFAYCTKPDPPALNACQGEMPSAVKVKVPRGLVGLAPGPNTLP